LELVDPIRTGKAGNMNTLKTLLLMSLLGVIVVTAGYAIAGKQGLIMGVIVALIGNFAMYWYSDSIAIAADGAQPVSQEEAPELYDIVRELCREAKLPMPRLYISPNEQPNAFATGRNPEHAAVAVTVGILRILNRRELKAVLGHELGHVLNRDILITTIASMMAAVISFIGQMGMYGGFSSDERERGINPVFAIAMAVLAPLAAMVIKMAISRTREYDADRTGAGITNDPEALASALAKLEQGAQAIPREVNPAFSNLYIVRPDFPNWFSNLMSTHPPIEDRIKRLQEMAATDSTRRIR
jgi:heat shock protein HtpX